MLSAEDNAASADKTKKYLHGYYNDHVMNTSGPAGAIGRWAQVQPTHIDQLLWIITAAGSLAARCTSCLLSEEAEEDVTFPSLDKEDVGRK